MTDTMLSHEWPPTFEAILSARLTEPPAPGDLSPELELSKAGLDSLATIGLMVELERTFRFTFPDDLLSTETFSTPGRLWAAIRTCLDQAAAD